MTSAREKLATVLGSSHDFVSADLAEEQLWFMSVLCLGHRAAFGQARSHSEDRVGRRVGIVDRGFRPKPISLERIL